MSLLNAEEFYNTQNGIDKKIENRIINFTSIDLNHTESVIFTNCTISGKFKIFNSETTDLTNCDKSISFINCILNNCNFHDCNLDLLIIENSNFTNGFSINKSNILKLRINKCNDIICDFKINSSNFKNSFWFSENTFKETGKITFFDNHFFEQTVFIENDISRLVFITNTFSNSTDFIQNKFHNFSSFENCDFNSINFLDSSICSLKFNYCNFSGSAKFTDLVTNQVSKLNFLNCEFGGLTSFDNTSLDILDIDRSNFDKSVSFFNTQFGTLKLFEIKFGNGAYFDEMKIHKVLDKSYLKNQSQILEWKQTLRAIKYELQKTDNKIDYNRYRNFELTAYYKELSFKNNFKDKAILWATKWSSDFGNWFWALGFTLLSGLFWYSILYRIENPGSFNFEKTNEFFVGAFRFFLVTDFYNPLIENSRTYLENGWSWLIFILGKIFIAFGIYEMIQSFRKFKA